MRVPWAEMRSNQSILKEINPEYSLEGLMLKLLYFGHLMRTASSLEKTFMLGKTGQEKEGTTKDEMVGWHHQLSGRELGKLQEMLKDRKAWHAAVHGSRVGPDLVSEKQQQRSL